MSEPAASQPRPDSPVALEARGLVKRFAGPKVLDGVDLQLRHGEVHALVGPNGAGKSTLIKILSGSLAPDEGTLWRSGRRTRYRSPADAIADGIAVVHQESSLVPTLSAAENLFVGRAYPRRGWSPLIDWGALHGEARRMLERLRPGIPWDVAAGRLSPAQQTLIAIARALALEATVLILDEPTASLTDEEVRHLLELLGDLRRQGYAVLYVSHRLREVLQIADRVTVLRDGRVVASQPARDLDGPRLVRLLAGQPVTGDVGGRRFRPTGAPLLEVRGLGGRVVRDVSLALHRGEILGVAGLTGSGRSELLHLLAGARSPRTGQILLEGRPVRPRTPGQALQLGIALLPEDRRAQALVPVLSLKENMTLAHLGQYALAHWLLRPRAEARAVEALVRLLGIRATGLDQPVWQLSGGNQQKAMLGRLLLRTPRVLLLDEPTRGVDVATKASIHAIIQRLARDGGAVVMVSSELDELLSVADRILVLHDGRVTGLVESSDASDELLSGLMYGRRTA